MPRTVMIECSTERSTLWIALEHIEFLSWSEDSCRIHTSSGVSIEVVHSVDAMQDTIIKAEALSRSKSNQNINIVRVSEIAEELQWKEGGLSKG